MAKERIWNDAEDKNVAAVIVYINDGSLFYDAAHTVEVEDEDLKNLFFKGAVANDDGVFKKAVAYSESDGIVWGGQALNNL